MVALDESTEAGEVASRAMSGPFALQTISLALDFEVEVRAVRRRVHLGPPPRAHPAADAFALARTAIHARLPPRC